MSIVLFLIILAALIFVHELGHFVVAKLGKIRVDEFAIGFPPRLFRFRYGETDYTINLVPFGGFVKIFGENPDEASLSGPQSSRSFIRKPRILQAAVLVAGVAMNIIFAWALFTVAFTIGIPAPLEYGGTTPLKNPGVVITEILPDSPALASGFEVGDRIIKVETEAGAASLTDAQSVRDFIALHERVEIQFTTQRRDKEIILHATPAPELVPDKRIIGFSLVDIGTLQLPLHKAVVEGLKTTYDTTIGTAVGLFGFVRDAFFGKAQFDAITGPVGIVNLVGSASDFGFSYLLNFTAFISINLAVINLLPFPALDGGRLAVVGIEAIARRPLNYKYVNIVNAVGFVILILLMVLVTYQDVAKLFAN